MNNNIGIFVGFTAGFTVGIVTGCKVCKRRYERISQEEIESVKESFARKYTEADKKSEEPVKSEMKKCAEVIAEAGYAGNVDVKEVLAEVEKPYVISPEEFGEFDEYETVSLTYYMDGTLTDENDEEVDDVDETVGADFYEHFGEYEDNAVFIRNDRLKCDFEILRDNRDYDVV